MDLNERVDIVLLMAKLDSVTLVRRELQRRNWESIPCNNTMRSIFRKFKETGSVNDLPRSGRPSVDDDKKDEIADHFADNPRTSIRQVAMEVSCSYGVVQKVARKELKLYPFKIQITQQLHEEDLALRMHMCDVLLEKIESNVSFLKSLIFSDESTFRLDGTVNRHNCRIWGTERPKETHERSQSSPKINVWMGLSCDQIYGPFFFDENITGEAYLQMLRTCFVPSLQPQTLRSCIFQQDGAPAHFARSVRHF